MGLNFRKSFRIAPGVRLNVGKKGISSISVGGKGARVSVGKKGVRSTVSAPGTGFSYSSYQPYKTDTEAKKLTSTPSSFIESAPPELPQSGRQVSLLLGIGILFLPYIFAWFTLREGYSTPARVVSFAWLVLLLLMF